MANQITVTGSLGYFNTPAGIPYDTLPFGTISVSVQGTNFGYAKGAFAFGTDTGGGTAIPLGGAAQGTLGWAAFINTDPANNAIILTSAGGAAFALLLPQETAIFRFDPAVTAPAICAQMVGTNTASAVVVEYLILPY